MSCDAMYSAPLPMHIDDSVPQSGASLPLITSLRSTLFLLSHLQLSLHTFSPVQDSVGNQQDKINSNLKRIEVLETAAATEKGTFLQEIEGG